MDIHFWDPLWTQRKTRWGYKWYSMINSSEIDLISEPFVSISFVLQTRIYRISKVKRWMQSNWPADFYCNWDFPNLHSKQLQKLSFSALCCAVLSRQPCIASWWLERTVCGDLWWQSVSESGFRNIQPWAGRRIDHRFRSPIETYAGWSFIYFFLPTLLCPVFMWFIFLHM